MLNEEIFEANDIVSFCLRLLQERIIKSGLTVKVDLPRESIRIFGDPVRIKQAALNIIEPAFPE